MKFKNKLDLNLFLTEVGQLDLVEKLDESYEPPDDVVEGFIKRRKALVGAIKDFRKSQGTKEQWKTNRWKIMKGIKQFHRSTEGKRFHRNMGRFLSTRYFRPKLTSIVKDDQQESLNVYDMAEVLKALTSAKTHALIDLEYYMPLDEDVEYSTFLDELLPGLDGIEKKLWNSEKLNEEDWELLTQITNTQELLKCIDEECKVHCDNMTDLTTYCNENDKSLCENLVTYLKEKEKK